MARGGTVGAGGGFGTGLLLLVGGLILKHSQSNMVSECSSGFGQLGQVFDPNVANKCSMAQELNSAAVWATWLGGIMLACSLAGLILLIIGASAAAGRRQRPVSVAAAGGSQPTVPGPGTLAGPPADVAAVPPSSPATLGCGHEPRPGARFCAVCGRPVPEAAGSAGPPADPSSGTTWLMPPPLEPTSTARASTAPASTAPASTAPASTAPASTGPAGPASWAPRPADAVAGRLDDPPPAWESRTAPGGPGQPGPGQPGARRSRWPVAAAVVLVAAGAIVATLVLRQALHGQTAAADPGTTPGAGQQQAPAATATASPVSPRQQAAQRVSALLAQSVADRSSIMSAVSDVSQCGPGLNQAPQTLSNAATSRQRLVTQLVNFPGRSALPSQMIQALSSAWQASAEADQDLSQWSQDELSQGCTRNDQADPNFREIGRASCRERV